MGEAMTGPRRTSMRSSAASARAAAAAGRLTAQGAVPPVASTIGAVGRLVHHQRTIRASVVAASSPGSKGCAPGTAQSGSGQAQPAARRDRPPQSHPGRTGHCHAVAQ